MGQFAGILLFACAALYLVAAIFGLAWALALHVLALIAVVYAGLVAYHLWRRRHDPRQWDEH